MPDEPTRSVPPHDEPTRSVPTVPSDGETGTFGPPDQLAGPSAFEARLDALAGLDSTRDGPSSATSGSAVPQVPGYELLGELGRGGMGVVFRAREVALNRPVALKMLLAGAYAHASTRARFLIEAESVASARHPNIVQLFAYGEHAGHPYLAMEYLPGGTLADRVRERGPLPPVEAAALATKLAEAMAAAHAAGVVHRDLKPQNVLLTEGGEPKVTDFGLAKVGRSDMTATGAVLGTPSYMAPEQAAGKTREVGTAADVYGLGAILYDLLTGRPPFKGDSQAATIQMVLTSEPVRPRTVNGGVPRDLETICLKCLEKEPAKRYPTAQALAEDLRRFLAREPVLARPVGRAEQAWRWCRRNKAVAGLMAAVLVVFAAGAGVAAYFAVEEGNRAKEADENAKRAGDREKDANTERNNVLAEQDRIRRLLYISQMNHASVALAEGHIPRLVELLEEARPRPGEPDLRGWEWHYLDRLTRPPTPPVQLRVPVPNTTLHPTLLAFSPDGSRLVTLDDKPLPTVFRVWDVATGNPVGPPISTTASIEHRDWHMTPFMVLSADGKYLAVRFWEPGIPDDERENLTDEDPRWHRHRIRLWEVDSGKELPGPPVYMDRPQFGQRHTRSTPAVLLGPGAEWVGWLESRTVPPVLGLGLPLAAGPAFEFVGEKDTFEPEPVVSGRAVVVRWDRKTGQLSSHDIDPGAGGPAALMALSPTGVAVFAAAPWPRLLGQSRSQIGSTFGMRHGTEFWDLAASPPVRLGATPKEMQNDLAGRGSWSASSVVISPSGKAFAVQIPSARDRPGAVWVFNHRRDERGNGRPLGDGPLAAPIVYTMPRESDANRTKLVAVSDSGQPALARNNALLAHVGGFGDSWNTFYHRESEYASVQFRRGKSVLRVVDWDTWSVAERDVSRPPGWLPPNRYGFTDKITGPDGKLIVDWAGPAPLSLTTPTDPSLNRKPPSGNTPVVIKDATSGAVLGQINPPAGGTITGVKYAAGGERLLVTTQRPAANPERGNGAVVEWGLFDASAGRLVGGTSTVPEPVWWTATTTPKGRWIVAGDLSFSGPALRHFVVHDARTGAVACRLEPPDGASVLHCEFDAREDRVLVVTGKLRGPGGGGGGAFKSDAKTGGSRPHAILYEVATGRLVWASPVELPDATPPSLQWRPTHPGSAQFASPFPDFAEVSRGNFRVAFAGDGRRLFVGYAFAGTNAVSWATRLWVGSVATGATERLLTSPPNPVGLGKFWLDPNQTRVGFAGSGEVRVFDLASGAEVARLPGHIGSVTGVAFSADGSRAFTLDDGGGPSSSKVRVWDVGTAKQLVAVPNPIFAQARFVSVAHPVVCAVSGETLLLTWQGSRWGLDGTPVKE